MIYLILLVLIFLSALFSSSETALLSLEKIKLLKRKKHVIVKNWLKEPHRVITFILVGNNIVNIVFSSLLSVYLLNKFYAKISAFYYEIFSFILISVIILIFGESIPKLLANVKSEQVFKFSSPVLTFLYFILSPLVNLFSFLSEIFIKPPNKESGKLTDKEVKEIVSTGIQEIGITDEVRNMISSVFKLRNKKIKEIMTPKKDIVFIDFERMSDKELINFIISSGYSRYPVYKGTTDNIVGILYVKDFLLSFIKGKRFQLKEILRKPVFIDEDEDVSKIYKRMLNEKFHLGIVKKYEKVVGLVTLEDILEEVFGEIEDEYD